MNNDINELLEGIETANELHPYDEGLADIGHAIKRGVQNLFGASKDAAVRNQAAEQEKADTAATNAETEQLTPAPQAAAQIIDLLNKALKKDQKIVDKNAKQQQKDATNKAVQDEKANIEKQQNNEGEGDGQ